MELLLMNGKKENAVNVKLSPESANLGIEQFKRTGPTIMEMYSTTTRANSTKNGLSKTVINIPEEHTPTCGAPCTGRAGDTASSTKAQLC